MRRLEGQCLLDVGFQIGWRLARQGVHQVEVEGLEVALRFFDGGDGLGAVVHPPQRLQLGIVKALHANRQAVDPGLAKGLETVGLEGAGIGLQRDFGVGFQRQAGADVGQQAVDAVGREQAGCATPNEDGVHAASPDLGQG